MPVHSAATLITDGEAGNQSYRRESVSLAADGSLTIAVKPRGGFVLTFD